jgi:hypothetical protein
MATDFVIHGMLMAPKYEALQSAENSFRAFEQMEAKMWVMWVGRLLFSVFFVWIYTRGLEAKAWMGQAVRYAIVLWLFIGVPAALDQYVLFRIPYTMAITWMAASAGQLLIAALVTGAICKKSA